MAPMITERMDRMTSGRLRKVSAKHGKHFFIAFCFGLAVFMYTQTLIGSIRDCATGMQMCCHDRKTVVVEVNGTPMYGDSFFFLLRF